MFLQTVQNIAARLLTKKNPEHISPVLDSLHWLSVCFRIDDIVLLMSCKGLIGQTLVYLSDLLQPDAPSRSLQSNDSLLSAVPGSRLVHREDQVVLPGGPKLWNQTSTLLNLS